MKPLLRTLEISTILFLLTLVVSLPCQALAPSQVETVVSQLRHPVGIAVASDGKIYFSQFGLEGCLSVYLPEEGTIKTAISGLVSPAGVALAPDGTVYVAESAKGRLWSYNPKTGKSKICGENLQGIWGVAVASDGTIYLTIKGIPSEKNPEGGKIVRFNPESGRVETLVSGLYVPYGLDVAPNGDLYFVEFGSLKESKGTLKVLRAETGRVETLLEGLPWPYDVAVAGDGTIYYTVKAGKVYAFKDGGLRLVAEGFKRLYGVALDPQNVNLYLTEFGSPVGEARDGTIRRISLQAPSPTQTKTVTETVTVTLPSLENLKGSLETLSLMVWLVFATSIIAVAAAVLALTLTLRKPPRR